MPGTDFKKEKAADIKIQKSDQMINAVITQLRSECSIWESSPQAKNFISWLEGKRGTNILEPELIQKYLKLDTNKKCALLFKIGCYLGARYTRNKYEFYLPIKLDLSDELTEEEKKMYGSGMFAYFDPKKNIITAKNIWENLTAPISIGIQYGVHEGAHSLGKNIEKGYSLSEFAVQFIQENLAIPIYPNTNGDIYNFSINPLFSLKKAEDEKADVKELIFEKILVQFYLASFIEPWVAQYLENKGQRFNPQNYHSYRSVVNKNYGQMNIEDLWNNINAPKKDRYNGDTELLIEDLIIMNGIKEVKIATRIRNAILNVKERKPGNLDDFYKIFKEELTSAFDCFPQKLLDNCPQGYVHHAPKTHRIMHGFLTGGKSGREKTKTA